MKNQMAKVPLSETLTPIRLKPDITSSSQNKLSQNESAVSPIFKSGA